MDIPFRVIIPARFASTRLPGKPILDIAGKPMIQHVYERAKISGAQEVIVATDDERIAQTVEQFCGKVCMTASTHPTGTDRIAEVINSLSLSSQEIIVNVQADEPFISPVLIKQVALDLYLNESAAIATLCEPINDSEDLVNPNIPKVVRDKNNFALYFSRAVIPWDQKFFSQPIPSEHYRHIGIYAYRAGFIKQFVTWPQSPIEKLESLEQLRALWHGHKILVATAEEKTSLGIDTEADLLKARKMIGEILP